MTNGIDIWQSYTDEVGATGHRTSGEIRTDPEYAAITLGCRNRATNVNCYGIPRSILFSLNKSVSPFNAFIDGEI